MNIDIPKSLDDVETWVFEHCPDLSEGDNALMVQRLKNRILDNMIDEASGLNQLRREIQAKQKHGKGMVK